MGRGAWWATVHAVAEPDTTECARAYTHTHTHTHKHAIWILVFVIFLLQMEKEVSWEFNDLLKVSNLMERERLSHLWLFSHRMPHWKHAHPTHHTISCSPIQPALSCQATIQHSTAHVMPHQGMLCRTSKTPCHVLSHAIFLTESSISHPFLSFLMCLPRHITLHNFVLSIFFIFCGFLVLFLFIYIFLIFVEI